MIDEELPRPDVAPLPPTEGGFEQVLRRARARKARRLTGLVGVVAVVALAGAALASPDPERDEVTVADLADESTTSSTSATTSSTSSSTSTSTTSPPAPSTTATTAPPTTSTTEFTGDGAPPDNLMHRGRVTDEAGNPLGGIYVYANTTMNTAVGRTGADGTYDVPCDRYSLLLWGTGPEFWGATDPRGPWAPTVVSDGTAGIAGQGGPPPCVSPTDERTQTVMTIGVVVTGVIRTGAGEALVNQAGVGIYYTPTPTRGMYIRTTDDTGRYWLHGLAPGVVHMQDTDGSGASISVPAEAGSTVLVDWTVAEGGYVPTHPGTPP